MNFFVKCLKCEVTLGDCCQVVFCLFVSVFACVFETTAQTDLHISGPETGFPVAVPQLCNASGAASSAVKISDVITRNLRLTGLFRLMNPSSFVETPGKCISSDEVAFSDWSVIGAEGLVRGEVEVVGSGRRRAMEVKLYLYDVLRKRMVVGKQYVGEVEDAARIAHKFSNEIMKFFTGESGVFGTKIAYISRIGRFKELFVMDLDGSNVRQLTRDKGLVLSPSWSPRGERIVYTSYKSRRPELYIASSDGNSRKQITKREGLELGAEFSPDGSELIASANYKGNSSLVLLDLKGELKKTLTRGGALNVSPSWSPDGRYVAFCSNRSGGPQIYVMPMSTDSTSSGKARRISYTNSSYCTSPSWSPKGDKIVFVCRAGANQLFLSSPDGQETAQLTYSGNNEDPAWSPDGRFIAYSSNLGRGGVRNIALISLLGGSPVRLSFSKSEDSQPAWSPLVE